jgi:hypothetical protein
MNVYVPYFDLFEGTIPGFPGMTEETHENLWSE